MLFLYLTRGPSGPKASYWQSERDMTWQEAGQKIQQSHKDQNTELTVTLVMTVPDQETPVFRQFVSAKGHEFFMALAMVFHSSYALALINYPINDIRRFEEKLRANLVRLLKEDEGALQVALVNLQGWRDLSWNLALLSIQTAVMGKQQQKDRADSN